MASTIAEIDGGRFHRGRPGNVCNFNNNSNVQGTGYTIVALHPAPGSTPTLIAADATTLVGCNAIALGQDDTIYAAAFTANDNPLFSSSEHADYESFLVARSTIRSARSTLSRRRATRPSTRAMPPTDRSCASTFRRSAPRSSQRAFRLNGGPAGSILGPSSGLQYEVRHDALFVVDGQNNSVTVISKVSSIHGGCLTVNSNGKGFGGPCKSRARILFSGPPLNGPVSSALLFDGSIVVGNGHARSKRAESNDRNKPRGPREGCA